MHLKPVNEDNLALTYQAWTLPSGRMTVLRTIDKITAMHLNSLKHSFEAFLLYSSDFIIFIRYHTC